MFGTILNRMIFIELLKVFTLALVSLTGLFLLAGIIQEAAQRGLSPTQVLAVIPLLVPNTLPFTIPATTLFATCVVYGRLSADSEVIAIKAAGVNLFTILKPAIALGLLTGSVTMFLYYNMIPRTHQILQTQVLSDAEEVLYATLKRSRCIKQAEFPYVLYVRDVQGRRLIDVIVKKRFLLSKDARGRANYWGYDTVARAQEAKLSVDRGSATLSIFMERCAVFGDGTAANIRDRRRFDMPLPASFTSHDTKNRPGELTWNEIHDRQIEVRDEIDDLRSRLADTEKTLAHVIAVKKPEKEVQEVAMQQLNLASDLKFRERLSLALAAELQIRPAMAVGCLCFVLIGCPVGIWASRSDFLSTFVICFLPTVFLYYPLLLMGTNLGKDGRVPMIPALWLADAVIGFIALGLIVRLLRR